MRWDEVRNDVATIRDGDLRKALKEQKKLKITRLFKEQKNSLEPEIFSWYAAVAYGLNDTHAIEQLRALKNRHIVFQYGCSQWGRWLEAHDIAPFAQAFGLWGLKNWRAAIMEMIKHNRGAELNALLQLQAVNGCKVVDPLNDDSRFLWEACIRGKQDAFDVLFPVSDFQAGGHRCFIAAVHNKNFEIADTIFRKCNEMNLLDEVRIQVDDYVEQEVETDKEMEGANVMYALIDNAKIKRSLEDVVVDTQRSRRM